MAKAWKNPVAIPSGIEISLSGDRIKVKGAKGALEQMLHPSVSVSQEEGSLIFSPKDGDRKSKAMTGTMRALIRNMLAGVASGFEKRLQLVGVGYRAQAQGQVLNLSLGFSHPIDYKIPEGISVETPSQTEVIIKGIDKQKVGQVAAEIRSLRPPEPYKGKGVRYADEHVVRKEAKKK